MYELNKHQEKWLQALESGEYTQGTETLLLPEKDGDPNRFCCLGVAADVCGVDTMTLVRYCDLDYLEEVVTMLKLRTGSGSLLLPAEYTDMSKARTLAFNLVYLNDVAEWSFSQIAKYIRENPENVFLSQED